MRTTRLRTCPPLSLVPTGWSKRPTHLDHVPQVEVGRQAVSLERHVRHGVDAAVLQPLHDGGPLVRDAAAGRRQDDDRRGLQEDDRRVVQEGCRSKKAEVKRVKRVKQANANGSITRANVEGGGSSLQTQLHQDAEPGGLP